MAEYWDIYDADRQKKRGTHLRGKPLADGDYHLVVNIWVYNSRGQVLLTQRHPRHPLRLEVGLHRRLGHCRRGHPDRRRARNARGDRADRPAAGADSGRAGAAAAQLSGHLHPLPRRGPGRDCDAAGGGCGLLLGGPSRSTAAWSGRGYCTPALKNFFTTYREKIPRGNPFRKHLRR